MKKSESARLRQAERMIGNTNTLGRPLSSGHRAAISASGKGRVVSDETRQKLRGRHVTNETRLKISAALKGRVMDDEWRSKNSAAQKLRPPASAETRARLSISLKGKLAGANNPAYGVPKTEAQKEVLRLAMTGRKFSADTIAKRSGDNHWKRRLKQAVSISIK